MSHFALSTKGAHITGQLSCIPIVRVLLRLLWNTGLSNNIHAEVHMIKFYKQD